MTRHVAIAPSFQLQPPQLCPVQRASYLLRFDDGNEEWSSGPVAISDNSQTVHVYLSKDIEPQLKWDKNYIVNIVIITEYGNASSAANFSKKDIETRYVNIIFLYQLHRYSSPSCSR